jgi:hypothetical protein
MPRASAAEHDTDDGYFQHPVRAVPLGQPSAAHLELIRSHVLDAAILDTNEPFVWQAIASNDREDAYGTRMHRSTLDNFAADATAGVAFMNSHRTGGFIGQAELPMGRTYDARVVGASAANPLRVEITSYTLRGINLTGLSTDAFIDGLRSGIARDVSVGFYGGEYRCSICDRDMLRDWECRHWPGRDYPKLDSKGNEVEGETVRAVAWIHDAHLAELSAVYDGACPGAMVSKARSLAGAGELKPQEVEFLEARYRVKLPHPTRARPGVEIPAPAREAEPMLTDEQIATIRLALAEAGQAPDADIPAAVRAVVDEARAASSQSAEIERLRPFEAQVAELTPLAETGRQYRADLVTAALTEGARAYGADFAEATYRGLLEAAPLETVKRMHADWKAVGDKQFPGGRATIEGHEPGNGTAKQAEIPSAAFAG